MDVEVFWIDDIGDRLESEGILPGQIFEFTKPLRGDLKPGGVVVFKNELGREVTKTDIFNILNIYVMNKEGEEINLKNGNPLFLSVWNIIYSDLC